jgi:hypothetical protein
VKIIRKMNIPMNNVARKGGMYFFTRKICRVLMRIRVPGGMASPQRYHLNAKIGPKHAQNKRAGRKTFACM